MSEIQELEWMDSEKKNHHDVEIRRVVRHVKMMTIGSWMVKTFFLVMIFYASLLFIDQKAYIHQLNLRNIELEKEKAYLESKVSEVQVSISSQFSLETIHRIASTELGMIYPTASRVISLDSYQYYSLDPNKIGSFLVMEDGKQ